MATMQVQVQPFNIPDSVDVKIGGETISVLLCELDSETLETLIAEFAERIMNHVDLQRKA